MLSLGLTAEEHAEYVTTLASTHEIAVTVQILDNQHNVVSTVTNILMDGQVDAKVVELSESGDSIDISRTCRLVFLDPGRTMTFDSDSPADGAIYLDRMIRVVYSVRCPSRWVDVSVFTGPVSKCDRDGDMVNVEAQGKEAYGLRTAGWTFTYTGLVTVALKAILSAYGETSKRWDIPDSTQPLVKPITVARDSRRWVKAWTAAAALNRILYYDGRGVARAITAPTKPSVVIRSGNGGLLMSDPQISFDTTELKNRVLVLGGKPAGSGTPVSATVTAPTTHPLSPLKIGLGDAPGYEMLIEENTNIRTPAAALARAKTLLAKFLRQQVDVTYTSLPIPHLEPWDIVTLQTPRFSLDTLVGQFSLPLVADKTMTVGYQTNLTQPRRVVRRA